MATKTIGSAGRDYSSVAAWEDYLEGLGSLSAPEVGELYNDSTFTLGAANIVDFTGITGTTSTNTITLRCASGQSFKDNANVRTNALRYNASNGVAFSSSNTYTDLILVQEDYIIIEGIQVYASSGPTRCIYSTNDNLTVKDCIFEGENSGALAVARIGYGSGTKGINVLAVNRGTGGDGIEAGNGARLINCAAIRPSNITAAGTGFPYFFGTPRMDNCETFGFTTACGSSGSWSASSVGNATDQASGLPGTGQVYSVTYSSTSPFTNADESSGTHDFRLANDGNGLINAGTKDATNAPNDISGTTRADPCEIGVWELAAAASFGSGATRIALMGQGYK